MTTRPRLIKEWQLHLKIEGREPRTLQELALAKAGYDYHCRLAEIKAISAKLALLDELVPALAARGISFAHRDFTTYNGGKTLRMHPCALTRDNALHDALVALGFREIERRDWGRGEAMVTLKLGRSLVLEIEVKKAEAPAAAPSAETVPA